MECKIIGDALQSLLAVMGEPVIFMSRDGFIIDTNDAAASLFEYSRAELQGAPITQLMPPEYAAHHPQHLRRYLETGVGAIIGKPRELQGLKRSGLRFPMELNLGRGDISGNNIFTAIVRDLTERNQRLDALLTFKEKTEVAGLLGGIGVWEWNPQTQQISFGNSAMFGLGETKLQIDYCLFIDAIYVEDRERVEAALQACRNTKTEMDIVYRVIWYGDTLRWIRHQLTAAVDAQGQLNTLIGFVQDITLSKNYELELVQARAIADAASVSKTVFLSNMNHELRTPLNAILGFNQLLQAESYGVLSEGQKLCVARIKNAGDYLLGLIEGVLDFNQIEANKDSISAKLCHINSLVADSLKMIEGLAAQHNVELRFKVLQADPLICVDPIRFRQVITNLIANAIKYAGAGKVVEVVLAVEQGKLITHVLDQGDGIPADFINKLFVPLERQFQHSGIPGFGLGLALAKRLVEAMDGVIGCNNRPLGGSDFWFSFPKPEAGYKADEIIALHNTPARDQCLDPAQRSVRAFYHSDNSYESHLVRNLLRSRQELLVKIGLDVARLEQDIYDYRPSLLFIDAALGELESIKVLLARILLYNQGLNVVALLPDYWSHEVDSFEQLGCALVFVRPFDLGDIYFQVSNMIKNLTPYALRGSRLPL